MALDKGILHFWPFAKYAVAFPRMRRSIVTRVNQPVAKSKGWMRSQ